MYARRTCICVVCLCVSRCMYVCVRVCVVTCVCVLLCVCTCDCVYVYMISNLHSTSFIAIIIKFGYRSVTFQTLYRLHYCEAFTLEGFWNIFHKCNYKCG